ncbi:MAG TPA: oligosaccharide flippase family protein [Kofleriaceae bacterium]|jgi:PST family polysaccharide transporter
MSLAHKAARGALWTVVSSMGGRAVGVFGTLVMTRFLDPDVIGEVSDATILCFTANWLTIWGFGQYSVVKGRGDVTREVTWHATVAYFVLGVISLGGIALFGGHLTGFLDAPHAAVFIPGMALAVFLKRLSGMPERILTRQLLFRPSGLALALGETSYTVSALFLAYRGYGGMSIVYANIVQSCVVLFILVRAAGISSWAAPTKLSWSRFSDMLKFGLPLGVQGVAHQASRYWDNLAISHFFGPGATGAYNMAYNLADIPATQVGEQIALVLMPSMAELPRERRPRVLERSTALLSLIIFPLAVGLGLVGQPLIDLILPSNKWQEVAPLLTVLSCLSVFRPITWVLSAYLEAESKTNRLMFLEVAKVGILITGICVLQRFGATSEARLHNAAAAVGISFGLTAIAGVAIVVREGVSWPRLLVGFVQPAVCCVIMGFAVYGVHRTLLSMNAHHPAQFLASEIIAGAIAYTASALVLCRSTAKDLLGLTKRALKRA